ncbi:hypothetical protein ACLVWU_06530 [Bdellovibrio sp. HCB290]|uniref:hypothetical protein n=1 Tax=Bdellovibrio sp. HCB290 TaxID=3394356 RepID=UPI0039B38BA6
MKAKLMFILILVVVGKVASAEVSNDEMNKANSPLTPMAAVNFHDYIQSSVFGTDETLNTAYLRIVSPMMIGGLPQLMRMTIPYMSAAPETPTSTTSGIGDVSIFDIFLLSKVDGVEFGVGPLLVMPTASKDETGAGKWQAGAAGIVMSPQSWGMLGALITYQHDFAGDSDRPTQNIATAQPFLLWNLPQGIYLRSTGIMFFNWETGDYNIPLGAGIGKVWKFEGGTTMNLFGEPQWTAAHEGIYAPNFQTFVGLNFQFPLH